jgi:hypothetical protein
MPWCARLRHPIHLADGRILRTLADAHDMVLSLSERVQRMPKWQQLASLLMAASKANNFSLTAVVTGQIEETLKWAPHSTARLVDTEAPADQPPGPSDQQ